MLLYDVVMNMFGKKKYVSIGLWGCSASIDFYIKWNKSEKNTFYIFKFIHEFLAPVCV